MAQGPVQCPNAVGKNFFWNYAVSVAVYGLTVKRSERALYLPERTAFNSLTVSSDNVCQDCQRASSEINFSDRQDGLTASSVTVTASDVTTVRRYE